MSSTSPDIDPGANVRLRVSIILIGDELLDGWVADSNAHWAAGRLAVLGIPLDWIHTVPDTHAAIHEALSLELARPRPRVVCTSGGIGSTPDDVTMVAVARSLGVDVVLHPLIGARIDEVVTHSANAGNPIDEQQVRAIKSMALVPDGSHILAGSTGMIPGVVRDVDGGSAHPGGASIVVLPGVPSQFRDIFQRAVEPELLLDRGVAFHTQEFHHDHPESAFTGVLQRINDELPELIVGSYPGAKCVIRLKGSPDDVAAARDLLAAQAASLEADPAAVRRRDVWRARRPS